MSRRPFESAHYASAVFGKRSERPGLRPSMVSASDSFADARCELLATFACKLLNRTGFRNGIET